MKPSHVETFMEGAVDERGDATDGLVFEELEDRINPGLAFGGCGCSCSCDCTSCCCIVTF